jgi:anti-sigma regulatory factor (Ser/Thr protein kinase)
MVIGGWRGPGWRVFAADPRQCGHARGWAGQAAAGFPSAADPDDVALVVSEFFGNAVVHGPGGSVLVAYCLWRGGARIVVCDAGGRGVPVLREDTGVRQAGGRGLRVVNAVSARWGSFTCGQSLVVWSDLAQPLRAARADAWAWLPGVLAGVTLAPPGRVAACSAAPLACHASAARLWTDAGRRRGEVVMLTASAAS